MKNILVKAQGLTKKYGDSVAIDSLDMEVREGEIFGFLGPNGVGKTTIIKILLGLSSPTSGFTEVLGFDPTKSRAVMMEKIGMGRTMKYG